MHNLHIVMRRRIFSAAVVGRSVIDKHDFIIMISILPEATVDTFSQIGAYVVDRNDI